MRSTLATSITLLLLACVAVVPKNATCLPANTLDRPAQELDIYEAIFRYRMEQRRFKGPFFLSINGKDANAEFLARFAKSGATVKKASEAHYVKEPLPGWLRDKSNGEKGVGLDVERVTWISEAEVTVEGGSYCGGLCMDQGVYSVAKIDGRWVVKDYTIEIIS